MEEEKKVTIDMRNERPIQEDSRMKELRIMDADLTRVEKGLMKFEEFQKIYHEKLKQWFK